MSAVGRRLLVGGGLLALVVLAVILSPETVVTRIQTVLFSPWFPVVLLGLYALRPFIGWPITVLSG
ncbi:MAG: TVP38/TMEM64 family protein, partial [archaeon]